ncbi:GNAT family N-acetyltransferase [Sphingomonas sp. MMS24-J13]|uniref:GNAT family N-acetyltransferase n=1 Tax=Sphingomonas sp. MMS24-J13 TaxID=3238686 RepID=UPI00384BAF4C
MIDGKFALAQPTLTMLPSYIAALSTGYSPDNIRGRVAAEEQLARIAADAAGFVAQMQDPEGSGPPVRLLDGTMVPRLPGLVRWMWDGEFAGSIGLRWQPGSSELPPYVLGHIGYSVVPWRRRRGYASRALGLLLPMARTIGLRHVYLTAAPANAASQKIILANGGELIDRITKPASLGGGESLRFRIPLSD